MSVDAASADDTGFVEPAEPAETDEAPHPTDGRSWWRATWPVDRAQWLRLGVALAAFVGLFSALGFVMTDLTAPNFVTRFDEELAERFAANRTPLQDDLAHWGAYLAATEVKIGITALLAVVALVVWRRWHEPVFLAFTLVLEATVFIIVTTIVGRPRPDVPRLEDSPVNSSFPSGHVAAATVYFAFVVVVFWHVRSAWIRGLAITTITAVVGIVAWARMYQGMHYFSDVVTGIVLGLASVGVCLLVLGRPDDQASDGSTGGSRESSTTRPASSSTSSRSGRNRS